MNMNFAKFTSPVLDSDTRELYINLYGDNADNFIEILNTSPEEIAVISKMIAYLNQLKGVE